MLPRDGSKSVGERFGERPQAGCQGGEGQNLYLLQPIPSMGQEILADRERHSQTSRRTCSVLHPHGTTHGRICWPSHRFCSQPVTTMTIPFSKFRGAWVQDSKWHWHRLLVPSGPSQLIRSLRLPGRYASRDQIIQEARRCAEDVGEEDAEAAEIADIVAGFESRSIRSGTREEKENMQKLLNYVLEHKEAERAGCVLCPACLRSTPVKMSTRSMKRLIQGTPMEVDDEEEKTGEETKEEDVKIETEEGGDTKFEEVHRDLEGFSFDENEVAYNEDDDVDMKEEEISEEDQKIGDDNAEERGREQRRIEAEQTFLGQFPTWAQNLQIGVKKMPEAHEAVTNIDPDEISPQILDNAMMVYISCFYADYYTHKTWLSPQRFKGMLEHDSRSRLDLDKLVPFNGTTDDGQLAPPTLTSLRSFFDFREKPDPSHPDEMLWEGRPFEIMLMMGETAIKIEKITSFMVEAGISPDELRFYVPSREDKADMTRRRRMRQIITNFLRRAIKGAYPNVTTYTYFREADDVREYGDTCLCLPALGIYYATRKRHRNLEIAIISAHCGVRLPPVLQDNIEHAWGQAAAEEKRGKKQTKENLMPSAPMEVRQNMGAIVMTLKFLNDAPKEPPKTAFAIFVGEKRQAVGEEGAPKKKSRQAAKDEVAEYKAEWAKLDKETQNVYDEKRKEKTKQWEAEVKTYMELPKWKEYMDEAKTLKVPVRSLLHRKKKVIKKLKNGMKLQPLPDRPESMPSKPPKARRIFFLEKRNDVDDFAKLQEMWDSLSEEERSRYTAKEAEMQKDYQETLKAFHESDEGKQYAKKVRVIQKSRATAVAKDKFLTDMPKKPLGHLQLYFRDKVKELKKARPDLKGADLKAEITNSWKAMSDEEKSVYQEKGMTLFQEYEAKLGEFKETENYKKFESTMKKLKKPVKKASGAPPKPASMPSKPPDVIKLFKEKVKKGEYFETTLYNAEHHEQGAGHEFERKFWLHFCTVVESDCRNTQRKGLQVFHTDYFRSLESGDIISYKVAWFKSGDAKRDVEDEVAKLTGGAPRGRQRRDAPRDERRGADLEWSISDAGSIAGVDDDDEPEVRRRLAALKRETAPDGGKIKDKGRKAQAPDRGGEKGRSKDERNRDRRRDSRSEERDKKPALWFGKKRSPSPRRKERSRSRKRSKSRKEKKRRSSTSSSGKERRVKRRRKNDQADRGPYGVGQRQRYDGRSDDEISSNDELDDKDGQVFHAGPSGTSKHLHLQEYAEKKPGRLTARLLKKMQGILAREEGPTSYFLTVLIPQYRDRLNLRTSRELRSIAKALDLIAQGPHDRAGDVLSHEIQSSGAVPRRPDVESSPIPGTHSARGRVSGGERRDPDGVQRTKRRTEDESRHGTDPVEASSKGRHKEGARRRIRLASRSRRRKSPSRLTADSTPKEGHPQAAAGRGKRRVKSPDAKPRALKRPPARAMAESNDFEPEVPSDLSEDMDGCPVNLLRMNLRRAESLGDWSNYIKDLFKLRSTFTDLVATCWS
eukprot:s240_g38.t1